MDQQWLDTLRFHHTGCLTENIETSKEVYKNTLGFSSVSETFYISNQQVKVCFIEVAPEVFIELVEPQIETAFFAKILKSKNPFYHTGYFTGDFEKTLEELTGNGFYLVNRFNSEAFNNRLCAFLYTPQMQLIEIIEHPH